MFLRVGGSSWELKIDPKRLQEMINNNFEEDKTRRGEKKDNKNDKKKNHCTAPCMHSFIIFWIISERMY